LFKLFLSIPKVDNPQRSTPSYFERDGPDIEGLQMKKGCPAWEACRLNGKSFKWCRDAPCDSYEEKGS
jgi:hypothetical protein